MVQISRAIVLAYLHCMRPAMAHLCQRQGLTVTDLSYDCIAEAFARNAEGTVQGMLNFIASLDHDLDSIPEHGLFLAYKRFLTRIADAQLARLYAQADPAGSRIHRNVRDCLRESTFFTERKDFRGVVLVPLQIETLDHLGPYPRDELERTFQQESNAGDSIPEMLKNLHGILAAQSEYRRSVPLLDTVVMFKNLYQSDLALETAVNHPSLQEGLTDAELQHIRKEVESVLKEKILLTYLARGKITEVQARAMHDALLEVLEGWVSVDGAPESLYTSLSHHLAVNTETYEQEFRPKMEYMVKLAREEFSSRLMREL